MAMIEVDVKYVYGDYMIPWEEQDYHEMHVQYFRHTLLSMLEGQGPTGTPLIVDCEYYPDKRKFKIIKVTKSHTTRLEYCLRINEKFTKEYVIR